MIAITEKKKSLLINTRAGKRKVLQKNRTRIEPEKNKR